MGINGPDRLRKQSGRREEWESAGRGDKRIRLMDWSQ